MKIGSEKRGGKGDRVQIGSECRDWDGDDKRDEVTSRLRIDDIGYEDRGMKIIEDTWITKEFTITSIICQYHLS